MDIRWAAAHIEIEDSEEPPYYSFHTEHLTASGIGVRLAPHLTSSREAASGTKIRLVLDRAQLQPHL